MSTKGNINVTGQDLLTIPGALNPNETGWIFPEVIYEDSGGRRRSWSIIVDLFDNSGNALKIKNNYYDGQNIPGAYSTITVTHGIIGGKMQTTTPTKVTIGKNIGKANQTNVWTQALRDALSKYNDTIKSKAVMTTSENTASLGRYLPLLLKIYRRVLIHTDIKSHTKEIKLVKDTGNVNVDWSKTSEVSKYMQPKFDGVRVIARWTSTDIVDIYSRNLNTYPGFDKIKKQLEPIFQKYPMLYLDGELYKQGLHLQDISGIARTSSKNSEIENELEYHIYDCFIPPRQTIDVAGKEYSGGNNDKECSIAFDDRLIILNNILTEKYLVLNPNIKKVITTQVQSEEEVRELVKKYIISEDYEGGVLRLGTFPYEFAIGGHRTSGVLKLKPRFEEEYKVVGFTEGDKGKEVGAIIWELETPSKGVFPNDKGLYPGGITFTCVPKLDYQERYKLYEEMKKDNVFEKQWKGKMMTIQYEDVSKTGVPLRAKAITLRNYE